MTLLVFVAFFWVLYFWLHNIGSNPVKDHKGNVIRDNWQRSKDVMIFVGPFATAAIGYWFGSDGKDKAEKTADTAVRQANQAQAHAEHARGRADAAQRKIEKVQAQKEAILAVGEPDLLTRARTAHREAFSE